MKDRFDVSNLHQFPRVHNGNFIAPLRDDGNIVGNQNHGLVQLGLQLIYILPSFNKGFEGAWIQILQGEED